MAVKLDGRIQSGCLLGLLACTIVMECCGEGAGGVTPPHILFVVGDDVGYNDFGYRMPWKWFVWLYLVDGNWLHACSSPTQDSGFSEAGIQLYGCVSLHCWPVRAMIHTETLTMSRSAICTTHQEHCISNTQMWNILPVHILHSKRKLLCWCFVYCLQFVFCLVLQRQCSPQSIRKTNRSRLINYSVELL